MTGSVGGGHMGNGSRDEREEVQCQWIRHPWKKGGVHIFFCKTHHFLALVSVSFVFYFSLSLAIF